jgi:Flp pilus assembly protein TadG
MCLFIAKHFRRSRGTSLVEMAMVGMILIYLTLGGAEYAVIFLEKQEILNAARQGSRLASTPDATSSKVNTQIDALMKNYHLDKTGYSTTLTPTDVASVAVGGTVKVQILMPYKSIMPLPIPTPSTLTATVEMQKEGP